MLNFELDGDLGPGASTSESRSSSRCPGLRGKLNIKNAGHAVRRPTAAYPSRCRGKSETHISHCHLRVGPQRCQGCLRKGEEKVVPRTSRRQDSPTIAKSTFYPLITKNIGRWSWRCWNAQEKIYFSIFYIVFILDSVFESGIKIIFTCRRQTLCYIPTTRDSTALNFTLFSNQSCFLLFPCFQEVLQHKIDTQVSLFVVGVLECISADILKVRHRLLLSNFHIKRI